MNYREEKVLRTFFVFICGKGRMAIQILKENGLRGRHTCDYETRQETGMRFFKHSIDNWKLVCPKCHIEITLYKLGRHNFEQSPETVESIIREQIAQQ